MVPGLDLQERAASAAELFGVSKYYPRTSMPALKSVDLTIDNGEFFTVLGPSGSGKSTLLSLLAGFERVSEGRITIAGQDMTNSPPYKRNIGMVFQDYALFPHMNVFDNVYFPLKARKFGPTRGKNLAERVHSALKTVGLDGYEERRPAQLSGGQQQRVAVARALVYEPAVLLMDEPLSSLDRKLRRQLQTELVNIHRNISTTIIFVTHDQDEAMTLSDRIAVLNDGEVQQVGTPVDLYENPQSLFVATFIGDANIFAGKTTRTGFWSRDLGTEVPAEHGLPSGETAYLVLHPEVLRIEPLSDGESAENDNVAGTVSQMGFRGSHLEVTVELGNAVNVTALLRPHEAQNTTPGMRVQVSWAHRSARIVGSAPAAAESAH